VGIPFEPEKCLSGRGNSNPFQADFDNRLVDPYNPSLNFLPTGFSADEDYKQ
jgi:hypothetical protein